jgi:hypothetical protein
MLNSYNFPFIGTSNYALATSCQLLVKFYAEPTEHQKNKIISSAPSILGLDLTNLHGLFIEIMKHGIANKIKNQYGIGNEGLMTFQNEIEAWLISIHQYQPIEIAVQPDYYDEFDTERNE